ncbi:MAG: EAL domain-containing protein (putative c-di-GMP-specific phosphodiesterase class I) [Myxococcota bacterium]|jgi:EAL domain-containing protein (putative c-di-GMP-specific phosphodiesterase class I)
MAQILIVDGRVREASSVGRALRRAGHDVHEDSQARSALRAVAQRSFDLAVVDAEIPEHDGLTFLGQLRARQPSCVRVLSTEEEPDPRVTAAYQLGTIARILKRPCSAEAVISLVDVALNDRRALSELARVQQRAAEKEEEKLLHECLSRETLGVALQPIITAASRRVVAFEVLLRSRHPILHSPLAVLQAAERFGAIGELADIVARRAGQWGELLPEDRKLFINVHPEEFASVAALEARLSGLTPERVVLELNRSSQLSFVPGWEEAVAHIQSMGFALSLDNLGDHYSTMGMLSALMPAYLKADMSVIRGVDVDASKRRLVEMMCRFADASGAQLVAEGVETPAEAGVLIDLGVPLLQGYLFGRPSRNPDEVLGWLGQERPVQSRTISAA